MAENFDLIFGQNASQQYAWSDNDYQNGWGTIGNIPPTATQFDALQRRADLKAQDLNNRLAPIEENDTHDYRQPSATYAVGNIAYHATLPTGWYLECTAAGETGSGELTITNPTVGGAVSDGAVTWTIRKTASTNDIANLSVATQTTNGLMSATDKTKLDGIAAGANNYSLPAATGSVRGGVKVGSNISLSGDTISVSNSNVQNALGFNPAPRVAATQSAAGLMSASDKAKLDGVANNANNYSLPAATGSVRGGVKVGSNISLSGDKISLTSGNVTNALGYTPPSTTGANASGSWNINSATATKLQTPRTISLTGNASGSANFDGSGNVSINTTVNESKHAAAADTLKTDLLSEASPVARPVWLSYENDKGQVDNTRQVTTGNLTYTPSTKTLTAANFKGHLAGNADTATHATAADNADKLGGYPLRPSVGGGGRYGTVPFVARGGEMEIGKYIDWHATNGGTEDYSSRWVAEDNGTVSVGTINGNVNGNAATATTAGSARLISPFEIGTADAFRNVWFSDSDMSNKACYNSNIQYNPSTNVLKVGTVQGTATNADKLDGYHASDLFRHLGGNQTPVMTDIFDRAGTIDLFAMSAADKANDKAKINKSRNSLQNLWNTSTGIVAYGGDTDMSGGYIKGTLKLTQSYKNFDKILVVGTNDDANIVFYKLWNVYELIFAFSHSFRFPLYNDGRGDAYWRVYGSVRTGTATNYVLSTDTIWSCNDQGAGIIAIYGIKY